MELTTLQKYEILINSRKMISRLIQECIILDSDKDWFKKLLESAGYFDNCIQKFEKAHKGDILNITGGIKWLK